MKLLTQSQRRQLLKNGERNSELAQQNRDQIDFFPVVKLFCPWGSATWLLTELDPKTPKLLSAFATSAWDHRKSAVCRSPNLPSCAVPAGAASSAISTSSPSKRSAATCRKPGAPGD